MVRRGSGVRVPASACLRNRITKRFCAPLEAGGVFFGFLGALVSVMVREDRRLRPLGCLGWRAISAEHAPISRPSRNERKLTDRPGDVDAVSGVHADMGRRAFRRSLWHSCHPRIAAGLCARRSGAAGSLWLRPSEDRESWIEHWCSDDPSGINRRQQLDQLVYGHSAQVVTSVLQAGRASQRPSGRIGFGACWRSGQSLRRKFCDAEPGPAAATAPSPVA